MHRWMVHGEGILEGYQYMKWMRALQIAAQFAPYVAQALVIVKRSSTNKAQRRLFKARAIAFAKARADSFLADLEEQLWKQH